MNCNFWKIKLYFLLRQMTLLMISQTSFIHKINIIVSVFQGFPSKRFWNRHEKAFNSATHQQHSRFVFFSVFSLPTSCFFIRTYVNFCIQQRRAKENLLRDLFRYETFIDTITGLFAMYWVEKSTAGSNRVRWNNIG